ncbi:MULTISPECIES: YcfL family protein [unclassified Colwellia]|uniref:YcfL family protein n=1 Tax=unclassified Colwellia TaxID=196834 RepID=UPI0015F6A1AF|nr:MULTISPECIES: YcfL family protein [unclassified Colwellia]MBA6233945.1 YcfL family protein [Colwellia sp. MB02u-7]MBA6237580.1 YcfL family protein [Colwellia sp. MB02u-11]MBA6256084.1 YcfL family protein [Colwellia sp. MB3u-28]MBA6260817.1 YcfL family protein [Colwellia sp. MB3u-41]MBA6300619.1 YcfL family protein [Colwellia sp. MB3u-22]
MKNFISLSAFIIISSLILFGCAMPITSGAGTSEMTQGDDFSKHLEVHNPKLGQQLKIVDVKSRKANGLLEVNVALKSTYKKSLKLQYHFNWFDVQGFVVESRKTPWQPVELHGFQSTILKGLAPNDQVASFTVYVREVPEKAYRY